MTKGFSKGHIKRVLAKVQKDVPVRFHGIEPVDVFPDGCDGVFLSGNTGIGKTHMAVRLYHRFILDNGIPQCYWFRCGDLLTALREDQDEGKRLTWINDDGETVIARPLLARLQRAKLVVIDDLTDDGLTEWALSVIDLIISSRFDDLKPTIVTSNLSLDDIEKTTVRVSSRLRSFVQLIPEGVK